MFKKIFAERNVWKTVPVVHCSEVSKILLKCLLFQLVQIIFLDFFCVCIRLWFETFYISKIVECWKADLYYFALQYYWQSRKFDWRETEVVHLGWVTGKGFCFRSKIAFKFLYEPYIMWFFKKKYLENNQLRKKMNPIGCKSIFSSRFFFCARQNEVLYFCRVWEKRQVMQGRV